MSNPILNSARKQLDQMQQTVAGFDADLGQLQRFEHDGTQALPTVTAARVLVGLADLVAQLDELRDCVTEATSDLPDEHQHGIAGVEQ